MKLYGDSQPGNRYKIKLLAALLHIELDWIHLDILKGEKPTRLRFSREIRPLKSLFWNGTTGGIYPSRMRF